MCTVTTVLVINAVSPDCGFYFGKKQKYISLNDLHCLVVRKFLIGLKFSCCENYV